MKQRRFLSLRFKLLIPLLALLTVLLGLAFYSLYTIFTRLVIEGFREDIQFNMDVALSGIDGDRIQGLYADYKDESGAGGLLGARREHLAESAGGRGIGWPRAMNDPRYWEIMGWFGEMRDLNPRAVFYTYTSPEPGVVQFIADGYLAEDETPGSLFGERVAAWSPEALQGLEQMTYELTPYRDKAGIWVSGYAPIRNSNGEVVAALGVDIAAGRLVERQMQIRAALIPAFIVAYVALAVVVLLVANGVTAPIRLLSRTAGRVGEGQYEKAEIKMGLFQDEVTALAQAFNIMIGKVSAREEQLKQEVTRLKIIIDESKRGKQVEEITTSDFFQDLQAKARDMRRQIKK